MSSFSIRFRPAKSLLLATLFVGGRLAIAQTPVTPEISTIPPVTSTIPTPINPTDELAKAVESLVLQGNYDKAIEKASPSLKDEKDSDSYLRYLRGRAAYAIGFYGMAQSDFSQIGDFKPNRRWPMASDYVRRIDTMKQLAPTNIREIKSGDVVVFRVYYDKENLWTQSIIKLLPQAYAVNYKLLNRPIAETPVFIFSDYERFKRFYALNANGALPSSWVWAAGKTGGIYFCQSHPTNTRSWDVDDTYFRISVAHEFNHCVVGRILGGAPIPNWFSEGLAMMTSPKVAPAIAESYDKRVKEALQANALLDMAAISRRDIFRDSVESQNGSDAYAQSYSMTNYLISKITPEKLTSFLEEVRDSRKFDTVLLKYTSQTPDEFYAAWLGSFTA